jgi:hypothetical protein
MGRLLCFRADEQGTYPISLSSNTVGAKVRSLFPSIMYRGKGSQGSIPLFSGTGNLHYHPVSVASDNGMPSDLAVPLSENPT